MYIVILKETGLVLEFGEAARIEDDNILIHSLEGFDVGFPNGEFELIDVGDIELEGYEPNRWIYAGGTFTQSPDYVEEPEPPEPPVTDALTNAQLTELLNALLGVN